MITSEELRVSALAASAKRGKTVAQRRIFGRWLGWSLWQIVLPVIGLAAVLMTLAGLIFWQYHGYEGAYVAAQKWVQQYLGDFQPPVQISAPAQISSPAQAEIIVNLPAYDEAKPDLKLDRQLRTNPAP